MYHFWQILNTERSALPLRCCVDCNLIPNNKIELQLLCPTQRGLTMQKLGHQLCSTQLFEHNKRPFSLDHLPSLAHWSLQSVYLMDCIWNGKKTYKKYLLILHVTWASLYPKESISYQSHIPVSPTLFVPLLWGR